MKEPKPVRLSNHAKNQLSYRGTSEGEIIEAIRTSPWEKTDLGRLHCKKGFAYHKEWNGKHYGTKQVRPIFVDEENEIVIVTVYVYYF